MKNLISSIIILFAINIIGQNSVPDHYKTYPTFTGNTYNETGMRSTGSIFVDGKESINNYNGSLSISFSTKINLPNDLGGTLSLVYNPNVNHKYFVEDAPGDQTINPSGYSFNYPSWIIGFKDLALQLFNFENNYYGGFLVDGYHFNNNVGTRVNAEYKTFYDWISGGDCLNLPPMPSLIENDHYDMIKLLRADGGTNLLLGPNSIVGYNKHVPRTGDYFAFGEGTSGYAKLEYLDQQSQPAGTSGLRKMYYYPGDGLAYEFVESYARYFTRDIFDQNYLYKIPTSPAPFGSEYWFYNNNNNWNYCGFSREPFTGYLERRCSREPKIFYLTKISTQYGDELTFEYQTDVINGRKNLKSIYYNKYDQPNKKIFEINYNMNDNLVVLTNLMANENIYCNLDPNSNKKITSIKNNLDHETAFTYTNNIRRWWEGTQRIDETVGHVTFFGTNNVPLIQSINYYNGKITEYEYYNEPFGGGSYENYYPNNTYYYYDTEWSPDDFYFTGNPVRNVLSKENMLAAYRDNYTMYMIKKRKVFENDARLLEQEYLYSYEDPTKIIPYDPFDPEVHDIITKIITTNKIINDQSISSSTKTEIFNYSSYAIGEKLVRPDMNIPSYGKVPYGRTIKLKSEKIFNNANSQIEKQYLYNMGTKYNDNSVVLPTYDENKNYYIGIIEQIPAFSTNFDLIKTIDYENGLVKDSLKYEYEYGYEFKNYSPTFNSGSFVKLQIKEIDLKGYCKESSFQYLGFNNNYSAPIFYEQIISNREYSTISNIDKNNKQFIYYPSHLDGKKNKLEQIVDYSSDLNRTRRVVYDYYTDFTHKGFLKKETFFKNNNSTPEVEYEYFYNSQLNYSYQGYVVNKSGTKSGLLNFSNRPYQYLPFKLKTITNGQTLSEIYTGFDARGNLIFQVDANRYLYVYQYDLLGRITAFYIPGSFWFSGENYGLEIPYLSIQYDDINNKKTLEEYFDFKENPPKKKTILEEYDPFGKIKKISVKNNNGIFESKREFWYNYYDKISREKDGMNRFTYYKYDYFSRKIETKFLDNSKQSIFFLGVPPGGEGGEHYESFDEESNKARVHINSDGTIKSSSSFNYEGSTLVQYTLDHSYNPLKQLVSTTSPRGLLTSYEYDVFGNVSQRISPDAGTEKYKYDVYGNLRFVFHTSAQPVLLFFSSYDKINRLLTQGEKSSSINEFNILNPDVINDFDNNSNYLTTVNMYDSYNPTGVFSNMAFPYPGSLGNLNGRLVGTAYRDKPTDNWNYKLYSYDALGRVFFEYHKMPNGQWKKISHYYDNSGNQTWLFSQDGPNLRYYYDNQLRLIKVDNQLFDQRDNSIFNYSYNAGDQVVSIDYKNNYGNTINYLSYNYNPIRGWLSSINEYLNMSFSQNYFYNLNGNISTLYNTNLNGLWPNLSFTYSYDNLNRLKSVTCMQNQNYSESFTYDRDGNITSNIRSNNKYAIYYYSNNSNRLIGLEDFYSDKYYYFNYDAKGNTTLKEEYVFGNSISFNSFNNKNLPLSLNVNGTSIQYKYDDRGKRVCKKKGDGSVINEFYLRDYLGRELAVYDLNSGRIKFANIFANGLMGMIKVNWHQNQQESAYRFDERYYYLKDHLGNIRQVIDERGEIISATDYYPFGEILRSFTLGGIEDRYKITEKERDTETNLDYFGARYYDSRIGRWLQVDPMSSQRPGLTPYNYCQNNPLVRIDPTGMLDENWVTSTIAGVQGRMGMNNIIDGTTVTVNGDDKKKKNNTDKNIKEDKKSQKLKNTALIGSGVTVGLLYTTKDIIGNYGWQQSNSKLFDLGLNFSAESAHFEKLLAKMKALGYLGFFGSTGIKGYDLLNNYSDQKLLDYSINTFYGLMVFCSTPGFIVGAPHFLVDEIVGWKNIWLLDNQMLMK